MLSMDLSKVSHHVLQIDKLRAELSSDQEAFSKEKHENEVLFEQQQQSMRELQEVFCFEAYPHPIQLTCAVQRHRRETEEWINARRRENDSERQKIATEWSKLQLEEQRLKVCVRAYVCVSVCV